MKQDIYEPLIDYIHDNYYDDADKIAGARMIGVILAVGSLEDMPEMIDKIALFNGLKKSYPPKTKEESK